MRTTAPLLGLALLASACGTMERTAQVRDDVYDIPDRRAVAAAAPGNAPQQGGQDDYYDPNDTGNYALGSYDQRSYNDITYNDPAWYNQGRFGFGVGVSSWGPSYGMGMSYGYPGYYGDPFYNPYWGNSYMSGYGMWGYPYSGWNMGVGMGWGYPYYGYYPPYYGGYYGGSYGCMPCYACGTPYTYAHRPSLTGGGGGGGTSTPLQPPVRYRPNTLLMRPAGSGRPTMERMNTTNGRGNTTQQRSSGGRMEGTRGGSAQPRMSTMGGTRSGGGRSGSFGGGGSMGGGSMGGGSRPSTGGGRR